LPSCTGFSDAGITPERRGRMVAGISALATRKNMAAQVTPRTADGYIKKLRSRVCPFSVDIDGHRPGGGLRRIAYNWHIGGRSCPTIFFDRAVEAGQRVRLRSRQPAESRPRTATATYALRASIQFPAIWRIARTSRSAPDRFGATMRWGVEWKAKMANRWASDISGHAERRPPAIWVRYLDAKHPGRIFFSFSENFSTRSPPQARSNLAYPKRVLPAGLPSAFSGLYALPQEPRN